MRRKKIYRDYYLALYEVFKRKKPETAVEKTLYVLLKDIGARDRLVIINYGENSKAVMLSDVKTRTVYGRVYNDEGKIIGLVDQRVSHFCYAPTKEEACKRLLISILFPYTSAPRHALNDDSLEESIVVGCEQGEKCISIVDEAKTRDPECVLLDYHFLHSNKDFSLR